MKLYRIPQVGEVWRDTDPRGGSTIVVEWICAEGCTHPQAPRRSTARVQRPHAHVINRDGPRRPRTMLLTAFRTSNTKNKRGYKCISGPA